MIEEEKTTNIVVKSEVHPLFKLKFPLLPIPSVDNYVSDIDLIPNSLPANEHPQLLLALGDGDIKDLNILFF